LLVKSGFSVTVERPQRRKMPFILVGGVTQALLCDIAGDPGLFRDFPRIRKRTVVWGPDAEARVLDHSAAIVSEQALLDRLWTGWCGAGERPAEWTILAAAPAPGSENHFGSRKAHVAEVDLKSERAACWIESFDCGWMFLIAREDSTGSLISVGARPRAFLESSRCIADLISGVREAEGEQPAYPRIVTPMWGSGWILCGTAAMALDPLCGDGSGHSIREGILASAVLRAIARGSEPRDVLEHYEFRLRAAFQRHLELCEKYYAAGRSGPWWDSELALLRGGLQWSRTHAAARSEWRYRLEGFDLLPA